MGLNTSIHYMNMFWVSSHSTSWDSASKFRGFDSPPPIGHLLSDRLKVQFFCNRQLAIFIVIKFLAISLSGRVFPLYLKILLYYTMTLHRVRGSLWTNLDSNQKPLPHQTVALPINILLAITVQYTMNCWYTNKEINIQNWSNKVRSPIKKLFFLNFKMIFAICLKK